MPGDRITFGAAALPEPDRAWLAAAERLPIESLWQGGHVLPRTGTGEAITRLALLTAWTERVRVGTAILVLPLYQPVVVAKQLADLDAWSGGRVSVGVGVGGEFPQEFEAVGVPVRRARRPHRRGHGRAPRPVVGQARDPPRPVRRARRRDPPPGHAAGRRPGRPGSPAGRPLVVSGRKEPAMRRAARRGDGWMPYLVSPGRLRPLGRPPCGPRRPTAGRDLAGFEWMLYTYCSIRPDGDRARDDVATFLGGAYGDKAPALLDRIAPAGTPDEVAARLQEYVDAGVRHFVDLARRPRRTRSRWSGWPPRRSCPASPCPTRPTPTTPTMPPAPPG